MRSGLLIYLLLLCCLLPLGGLHAQSPEVLRQKRERLQRELRQTNQRLKATRTRRGAAVGEANLIRQQIEQRTELLETLRAEATRNAQRLQRDSSVVAALSEDLDRMGVEYGNALRAANRARLTSGWLAFLLSAEGFNDAFRRAVYLRQYRNYRSRQARLIQQTRGSLENRLLRLEAQRSFQDSLVYAAEDQDATLREELAIQTAIVDKLSTSEQKLLQQVQRQQQQADRLTKAIREAISTAVAREERRERARRRSGATASETNNVGASISQRRGQLGWPVRGTVVRRFGPQPHPDVPSVTINNSGIDVDAGSDAAVEAVFSGEVISARQIPGLQTVIMVRHGGYYTVYSNVAHPRVKAGEEVRAGQQLGLTSTSGEPLHFELWRGKTPLNPERWLGK